MTEREKVVAAVECCFHLGSKGCQSCPYVSEVDLEHGCTVDLAGRIIAQLKAPDERVMTLEEQQAIETQWNRNTPPYLFVEGRSATTESRWMSWGFMHDFVRLPGTIGVQNYGSKWRVWNLQPTPEQMRDTKWEE